MNINNIRIVPENYNQLEKNNYLVALPCFPNSKGFNHRTVLVSAINENEARDIAMYLKPNRHIGDIKKVNY